MLHNIVRKLGVTIVNILFVPKIRFPICKMFYKYVNFCSPRQYDCMTNNFESFKINVPKITFTLKST